MPANHRPQLLKRLGAWLSGESATPANPRPTRAQHQQKMNFFAAGGGGFDGAKRDRLTQDWNPGNLSPNLIHRMDAGLLRERARDLVLNNPLARAAVGAYIANVVECGITPKPLFQDAETRRMWMQAWQYAARKELDITGHQTFEEQQALWLEEVIVGGGCLTYHRYLGRGSMRGRRLPYCIELIPEERFAEDQDYWPGRNKKSANPIYRGIEVDTATGRTIRYWIKPTLPNDLGTLHEEPIGIPADQCDYAFHRRRIGQTRGFTMLGACIMWLWKLGYYTDNELMNSAIRSNWTAMILTKEGQHEERLQPDCEESGIYGTDYEHVIPGTIFRGRPGDTIQAIGPNTPGGDAAVWNRLIVHSIAIGMELSYLELMRDASDANFAAMRGVLNMDRKRYRPMQRFTMNHLCYPVYERFAESASLNGLQGFPSQEQLVANRDEWLAHKWRAPGWASVTPIDDAKAFEIERKNGVNTCENYVAERGGDWEDTFEQLDRENESAEDLELVLASNLTAAAEPEEPSAEAAADNASKQKA